MSWHRDVRAAVDLCHRDGSLKQTVAADPGRYMHEDPRLAPTLDSLRASGRKVFLATNSLWDYTHVVMNFLLCGAADLLDLQSHEPHVCWRPRDTFAALLHPSHIVLHV